MDPLGLVFVLVGVIAGASIVWLMKRGSAAAPSQLTAQVAELRTRLEERDLTIAQLKEISATDRLALQTAQQQLLEQTTARATADQRAARVPELEAVIRERDAELAEKARQVARLMADQAALNTKIEETERAQLERLKMLEETQAKLAQTFKGVASEALAANNQNFLELAKSTFAKNEAVADADVEARRVALEKMVQPLKESLEKVDTRILDLEKTRAAAYGDLSAHLKLLVESQTQLQTETGNLVRALRAPAVRGRWGEMQLRRVVEMAGMVAYCDFNEQVSMESEGARLRPDMIIRLPNQREIIVDSKVSLQAYLDSVECSDDVLRQSKLQQHAQQIRQHLTRLASKAYWDQLSSAPDFVVAFLPGETFFSAALQQDPGLIEYGVENRVLLATPTTLIALLKAVAYGWRQERIAQNAQEISDLGKQLYERVARFAGHFDEMRKGLEKSVDAYNKAAGSLESRVLVSARRFKELAASAGEDIQPAETITRVPRAVQRELIALPDTPDLAEKRPQ